MSELDDLADASASRTSKPPKRKPPASTLWIMAGIAVVAITIVVGVLGWHEHQKSQLHDYRARLQSIERQDYPSEEARIEATELRRRIGELKADGYDD